MLSRWFSQWTCWMSTLLDCRSHLILSRLRIILMRIILLISWIWLLFDLFYYNNSSLLDIDLLVLFGDLNFRLLCYLFRLVLFYKFVQNIQQSPCLFLLRFKWFNPFWFIKSKQIRRKGYCLLLLHLNLNLQISWSSISWALLIYLVTCSWNIRISFILWWY